MMTAKLLWIVFVLNLYTYGKLLVNQINSQIVCDHRLAEDNRTLNNRTDLPIDTQYQQKQCQAQNCNFSTYLKFDIQNYNQFCLSLRITNDGQLYKLEYELQRIHSILSKPFYIYLEFQPISSMETADVHCHYQQANEQRIRLRIKACNCSEKFLPPQLSLCPQSTISTGTRLRTTDHTSIIVNRDNNTGKLSKGARAAITVALSLGICVLIAVIIYQAMKCSKGKVSTNTTDTPRNNATTPTSMEVLNNESNGTTTNSNNNDNFVSQREGASNHVELHLKNYRTRNDNSVNEMCSRTCTKEMTERDRHQAAPAHYIPEEISKMMLEINTSFDSTDQ